MRTCIIVLSILGVLAPGPGPGARAAPRPDDGLAAALRGLVTSGRHDDLGRPDLDDVRAELVRLYERDGWRPRWLDGARPDPAARALLARLAGADSLGLDPADYDAPWLERTAGALGLARGNAPAARQARFDVGLSVAALRFVSALACGRVDPHELDATYDIPRTCPPGDSLVVELHEAGRQGTVLAGLQPVFHHYQLLKNGLARYRELARDSTLHPLPAVPEAVRPGEPLAAAPALRRLLRATGDLPVDADGDARDESAARYDSALVGAVRRFQARHGLLPDGILWPPTVDQLDRPFAERVRSIELTLERWRWLPRAFSAPPVIVNIPAFRLYAFRALPDRREDILAMDVLVGAAVRNETPVFSAMMTYVVFRPYWELPMSIQKYELGPRALTDRANMERLGYVLVPLTGDDRTPLPLTPENVARIGRDLRMRQRPGPLNALGLVKFMLPNRHDIYLHDTPADGLFALSRRDFSHGCIRVSDPVALAVHVLGGPPRWNAGRVRAAMVDGEDDVRVDLPRPVPVLVVYATAIADEAEGMHFYEDIYDRDAQLEARLRPKATSGARPRAPG